MKIKLNYQVEEDRMRINSDGLMQYNEQHVEDTDMGHYDSQPAYDTAAKETEAAMEFLRIGDNGENCTHVLHQSQYFF